MATSATDFRFWIVRPSSLQVFDFRLSDLESKNCVRYNLLMRLSYVIQIQKSFDPQFPLRLSENREIRHFTQRDLAINFHKPFGVVEESPESILRHAAVIVEALDKRVVGRGGRFLVDP